MLDIDHFKAINDVHGHQVGDEVLVRVAAALQSQLRASDLICRWGGEEFLVMVHLAGSSQQAQDNLQKLAGTLVRAVRSLSWAPSAQAWTRSPSVQEHGCFSTGWTFRPVWMKQTRLCCRPSAAVATGSGVARFGNAIRFDASMAQPGGVELGDVQGMAPQLQLSLLAWWTLHGHSGIPWKLLPWCQPCPHVAPESLWHLDHRGDEDVSQHTLNEPHRMIA